jgi:hypothetical protein
MGGKSFFILDMIEEGDYGIMQRFRHKKSSHKVMKTNDYLKSIFENGKLMPRWFR